MCHPEQVAFFAAVAERNRRLVRGAAILEVGSYNVNGSIRSLFRGVKEYVGVDMMSGPGVDLVCSGHEVDHADGSYDLTLSGECFEHNPYWRETFANMVRMTRPGGLVAFSCATRGRPEHGTQRTVAGHSPGNQSRGLDYYRNLEKRDFAELPLEDWFVAWRFWTMPTVFDLYFAGVRAGGSRRARLPMGRQIREIGELSPVGWRVAHLPLRVVRRLVRDERRYQDIVLPYWRAVLVVVDSYTRLRARKRRSA